MSSPTSKAVAVLDTSSIIEVRRMVSNETSAGQQAVFGELTKLAERFELVFPRAVHDELEQRHDSFDAVDLPHAWTTENLSRAIGLDLIVATLSEVLAIPEMALVLDPSKPEGTDEADPHILAVALQLQRDGHDVTVLTEERRTRRDKMSLVDACGIIRVPVLSIRTYLRIKKIWPR